MCCDRLGNKTNSVFAELAGNELPRSLFFTSSGKTTIRLVPFSRASGMALRLYALEDLKYCACMIFYGIS